MMSPTLRVMGHRWWVASPLLAAAVAGFAVALPLVLIGLLVDPRQIGGNAVWLKPAKFVASSAAYCGTLLTLLGSVARPARGMRRAGEGVAAVLIVEVAIIAVQAARGTTSHFNVATPLDAGLFAVMGVSVAILLVASAVFAVGLCRASVADRAWGWALRAGMAASVVGAALGGFMLGPTAAQQAQLSATKVMPIVGGHTVGGADGGSSLPGVSWSLEHGDLRIPHFFGLHAVQAIPLMAWLVFRGLKPARESTRLAFVGLVTLSYAALVALLTLQALAGRSIVRIDAVALAAGVAWAGLTVLGGLTLMARERSRAVSPARLVVGA